MMTPILVEVPGIKSDYAGLPEQMGCDCVIVED